MENFADQIKRLQAMAVDDGDTWDLSDNDQAALKAILASHAAITTERDTLKQAIAAFLKVWPDAEKQINGAIALQSIRAGRDTYTAPSLVGELAGLRAALSSSSTPQEK